MAVVAIFFSKMLFVKVSLKAQKHKGVENSATAMHA